VAQVFVTGASGFIGGALATRLVDRGQKVVALARSDEAASAVARRGATVAQGDVLDEDSIADGMAGCALAYHLHGSAPSSTATAMTAPGRRGSSA
jgi:uncharacterized protein YbjT (DUF2867 family)